MGALLVCAGLFKIYHARQASPAQPAAMPVAAATPASPASPPLMLAALWAADIPRKAPELAVQLTGGGQILLSQFRGKVVMIDFVHTTCPHCQNASTIVERLYKEYGPRGFQPLGVAFNDNAALLVPDFVKMLGLTYPVGVAPRDTVLEYLQHSYAEPLYVPQMVFVDRAGEIRAQHGGIGDDFLKGDLESHLRDQIESLLKEPAHGQHVVHVLQ
jgi:peroxiredoxin